MKARYYYAADMIWLICCLIVAAPLSEHMNVVISFLFPFVFLFMPLFLIFGGFKRICSQIRRSKILKGRTHRKTGVFSEIRPFYTGKDELVTVPAGYSQANFIGTVYTHYQYRYHKIYDGMIGNFAVYLSKDEWQPTGQALTLHTLPRNFFWQEESLPAPGQMVKITYVTSSTGINYLISAQPA